VIGEVRIVSPVNDSLRNIELDAPLELFGWAGGRLVLPAASAHMGCTGNGRTALTCDAGRFELRPGYTFSVPGKLTLEGDGNGFIVSSLKHRALFTLTGPLEEDGRLKYIDGCSDSLLIPPIVRGDPCMNFLSVPPNTNQSDHTHPSVRIGMIISGEGYCSTDTGRIQLGPGLVFVIAPDTIHSFHTRRKPLRIVAWHPDSDTGPTNEDHPMINRTVIGDVSERVSR
jgi:AraC-like ligand binding domain